MSGRWESTILITVISLVRSWHFLSQLNLIPFQSLVAHWSYCLYSVSVVLSGWHTPPGWSKTVTTKIQSNQTFVDKIFMCKGVLLSCKYFYFGAWARISWLTHYSSSMFLDKQFEGNWHFFFHCTRIVHVTRNVKQLQIKIKGIDSWSKL